MRQIITLHRAGLLIALSLVTASAVVFGADRNLNQPGFSNSNPGQETWLGLAVRDVSTADVRVLKLPGDYGAMVLSVIPGGPAAKAGFQPGDVILEFAGMRVRSAVQLRRLIEETPPDRTVSIKISRHGKLNTLQVKVETRRPKVKITPMPPVTPYLVLPPMGKILPWPPSKPYRFLPREPGPKSKITPLPPATPFNNPFSRPENALGISGDDLTPQLAHFFGVKEGQGVLISRVFADSPASVAGLKVGDVIVRVGTQQVGSMTELRWALQTQENRQHKVTLGIVRNRKEREMSVLLTPGRHGVKREPIMALRYE